MMSTSGQGFDSRQPHQPSRFRPVPAGARSVFRESSFRAASRDLLLVTLKNRFLTEFTLSEVEWVRNDSPATLNCFLCILVFDKRAIRWYHIILG